ncbi:dynamin family protein [Williamsia sterculiae]|uniref:Dynamin family protein n=1 Tax=Williamsia sterculiae TaxID=1344003 RepID=A0A1N7CJL9_9NOCA|nr:dynamin family protein [Williamsia sterculiae]SIR63816.1 Dynamin family protein [Williamsia sterculiae]
MAAADQVRTVIDDARHAMSGDVYAGAELDACAARLDEPLRVALAGSLKAGKSTLLNALVGQDIAPTDATECTRVVTWYRRGMTPSVTAYYDDDRQMSIPVTRHEGRLGFDFGTLTADRVQWLDVEWPARALASTTLVDTPGTASLSRELSASTVDMLAPADGESGADAVVYLLRTLSAADTSMLERIGAAIGGGSGPLGVVGVVSRADELGAGRMDAMISAEEIAGRFAGELERTGLCQAVVPVAGLLALAARTLREVEFRALAQLAAVPTTDLDLALLSVDRFARPDTALPVEPALRATLAERFGVFGIRMAVTLIRLGTDTSAALASELLARSGLDDLRSIIDIQFAQRAEALKAHSALVAVERILAQNPSASAGALGDRVRALLADIHGFRELRLLGRLRTGTVPLPREQIRDLTRLVGGHGIDPASRLGVAPDDGADRMRAVALDEVRTWRSRAGHPLLPADAATACLLAARSAEGVLAQLG